MNVYVGLPCCDVIFNLEGGMLQVYWVAQAGAVGRESDVQCLSRGYPSCTVWRWVSY